MENTNLKTIEFTTEKGGVRPSVRDAVKAQALAHYEINLENFEKMPDGRYGVPVAIDSYTGDTLYLLVGVSVGYKPIPKSSKKKVTTQSVEPIGNLFD